MLPPPQEEQLCAKENNLHVNFGTQKEKYGCSCEFGEDYSEEKYTFTMDFCALATNYGCST